MRVTISDVARAAQVSKATVSLVLNDAPGVSDATRERVRGVMRELDYHPDALARSFSSRRTEAVALVLPPFREALEDPYYTGLLYGVLEAVRDRGYKLLLEVADARFTQQELWKGLFERKRVDGLLVATPKADQQYLTEVAARSYPALLINGELPELPELDYVGYDDFRCGHDAAYYLIGLRHTRIAHVSGPANQLSAVRRQEGFREALSRARLPIPPQYVQPGDYVRASGRRALRALLELTAAERPTAVFCANDAMALGVLDAAREAGLQVPRDLSIVGVDDTGAAAAADPPLTTFRQDVARLGRHSAERFIRKLQSRTPQASRIDDRWPMELVERASAASYTG